MSTKTPAEECNLLLSRVLHELAGAASLCWNPRPTGVFDSQTAIEHVEAAIAELRAVLQQPDFDRHNPHQPKVNHMQDFEQQAISRAVDALEAIAEHMGVLATMALSNAQLAPAAVPAPEKRKPGRPRKYVPEGVHMVGTPAPEAPAAEPAKPEPTEAERAEAFGKLKTALKECLSLHGEEVARQRLQFPKFSEVPYEAIPATIERLAA